MNSPFFFNLHCYLMIFLENNFKIVIYKSHFIDFTTIFNLFLLPFYLILFHHYYCHFNLFKL